MATMRSVSRSRSVCTDVRAAASGWATTPDLPGAGRRAEVGQQAVAAAGRAGDADPTSVEDEPEAQQAALGGRDHGVDNGLDLHRVGLLGDAEALHQPADVGVDRE